MAVSGIDNSTPQDLTVRGAVERQKSHGTCLGAVRLEQSIHFFFDYTDTNPRGPSRAGIPYKSFGIPRNLAQNLESGIFWFREFPNTSGYFNSVQLVVCSYKLVGLL